MLWTGSINELLKMHIVVLDFNSKCKDSRKASFHLSMNFRCRPSITYDAERLVWARRNILCATEMRPWMILEAFAERIVRLGAHRSSWRNGISEGSHKPFCSQPVVRAAAYPISFKWKLASRREKNLDWCCLSCSDSAIPAVGQNLGLRLLLSYSV